MDYSIFIMFMIILFGVTTWFFFGDLIRKVEKIEKSTETAYNILGLGDPVSKETPESRDETKSDSREISEWDNS